MKQFFTMISILSVLLIAWSVPAGAQKRVLVSPYGDAIPLNKNQGAAEIIKNRMARQVASKTMVCTDKATFGFNPANFAANTNHIAYHQDVVAMWYVAPASGTIDTVFWSSTSVGSDDSSVTIRIFNSNIYPGNGPGYDGYPKPGKQCWGYLINTNDLDNGVAAFTEDATDTAWHSTVTGPTPSFPAMGSEIWGAGGFPAIDHGNVVNSASLDVLGVPNIAVGAPFFITIRVYGDHQVQADETPTGFLATNEADSMATHNWKFYEHIVEIQPGFTCPGWVARGDFNILFWYSMTVTTNIPPSFGDVTSVGNTLSTGTQPIQASIIDCDPGNPSDAGVENAFLRYTLNGDAQSDIPMIYIGADTWEADLPGAGVNDVVAYKVVASDSVGFTDSTAVSNYKVVKLETEWYAADTGAACTPQDISGTGTSIDTSAFFAPFYSGSGTAPRDDGTAGPFDMGANFTVFGDTFRYAWIGVNGALALGKDPLDTLDVNANGFATTGWDFPNAQKAGRTDTANAGDMPGMFIAPFWADHILGDTTGKFGNIRYGNNGNSCLFIAEWDSIGAFDNLGSTADVTTFRAVINRCDRTIEFQYASVGTNGLDSLALVGMQADSNAVSGPDPGWIYVNRNMYPYVTKPHDNWCVRFTPKLALVALDGWNIVAVSMTPQDANYGKSALFPTSTSSAFEYGAGYVPAAVLAKGRGYWLKFGQAGPVGTSLADPDTSVTASVQDKWNLIGGPSGFVDVGDITPAGTTVSSSYYGYNSGGYYTATTIEPGHGYWVKVNGAGTLDLSASGAAAPKTAAVAPEFQGAGTITVRDAAGRTTSLYIGSLSPGRDAGFFELPPAPPSGAFDVRFGSGRNLETIPSGEGKSAGGYPILVQGAAYPVTVSWDLGNVADAGGKLSLTTAGAGTAATPIAGSGSVVFRDARSIAGLSLSGSGNGSGLPGTFTLGKNYPNPFNPTTSMRVDIPASSEVVVAVYDLLGRLVSTLLTGPQQAGSVTVTWDGRDNSGKQAPTGMYVVRMTSGDFTASQKVLMMK
jgi:hypothetical protein